MNIGDTSGLKNDQVARVITEALPYIKRYQGATIVVKYGGNAMVDEALQRAVARDIVLMKLVGMHPVLVHGGGPQINQALQDNGIQSEFKNGMRVTSAAVMEVVDRVLGGQVNKSIVDLVRAEGGNAVGLSGKNDRLITAQALRGTNENGEAVIDLGYVGAVSAVNTAKIRELEQSGTIPVIAPIGIGEDDALYNINADSVAAAIAIALKAKNMVVLSNIPGVLDRSGSLIEALNAQQIDSLKADGTIYGGMIPKVDGALAAIDEGVRRVTFIDGRVSHALLLEIFTDRGVGTQITA